jgi:hypothetical protein
VIQQAFVDGFEVFPVVINTIVPVEYADRAVELSRAHFETVETKKDIRAWSSMFGTNLGPIGSGEVTHVFCSRDEHDDKLPLIIESFIAQDEPWISKELYELTDDPEVIKSLFCVVVGDTAELLARLNLEVKTKE